MFLTREHRELTERLNAAKTAQGKAEILRAYSAGHGFTQFVYVFAGYPEDIINDRAMVHMTFPDEVRDLYADGGGVQNDPVAIRVNEIQQPEVMNNLAFARDERFSRHPLTDYFLGGGWQLGVSYPFKSMGGIGALTTFADNGSRKEQAGIVDRGLHSEMTGVASLFHESIIGDGAAQQMLSITVKERDALALVAEGHTVANLSHRLKISERAIEKRLFRARTKLGAKNTANAIYRAAVRGII
ncbi:MAG: helix-turn-helix transcriptional regulator [Pseudomonadota bacterium]